LLLLLLRLGGIIAGDDLLGRQRIENGDHRRAAWLGQIDRHNEACLEVDSAIGRQIGKLPAS
jgi:hypothetical protein